MGVGVGVRGARGDEDALLVGQRDWPQPRELRWLREPLGRPADGTGAHLQPREQSQPGELAGSREPHRCKSRHHDRGPRRCRPAGARRRGACCGAGSCRPDRLRAAARVGRRRLDRPPGHRHGEVAALRHRRRRHRGGEPAAEPHRTSVQSVHHTARCRRGFRVPDCRRWFHQRAATAEHFPVGARGSGPVGNEPGRGVVVATNCEPGYEEFPIDDETSTCVFESLVEPACYAGSRRVRRPDLGGADVCLYYSLDFFQPDGSCRQNYEEGSA